MLVASLALQQVREVGAVTTQKGTNTECKILTYISLALTIVGLVMFAVLHLRKSKLCRGCMFSNAVCYAIIGLTLIGLNQPLVTSQSQVREARHAIPACIVQTSYPNMHCKICTV